MPSAEVPVVRDVLSKAAGASPEALKIAPAADEAAALDILRHDCAHILAEAVQKLFPETKTAIGPTIADGFYYDFARPTPFTPEDLAAIEEEMHALIRDDRPFRREVWTRAQTKAFFTGKDEPYKLALLDRIDETTPITIYHQGDWSDLCRGPHGPSTQAVGHAFKLTRISGAYWQGDSRQAQLQRITGTAWHSQEELDLHLERLEKAKARDHRVLGPRLGLFHLQPEASGSVFWHPKGWTLFRTLESYIRRRLDAAGYVEVRSPQLVDRSLWEASGHWDKFRAHMFTAESEDRTLAIKPMNCPCHVQIFRQGLKSYRDLPLRMAEFGCCHRNEPSGALHGLMRVRCLTQDDAHIFCTKEQIESESVAFCALLAEVYRDLGFPEFQVRFADRPEMRAGSTEVWARAEQALKSAATAAGLDFDHNPGEGAFYGPKLEFILRDALGRQWQCGTLQVDFVLPERLRASYVDAQGHKQRPVMLHRAILGSLERFIAIMIENGGGRLPLWLAPVQIVVASISEKSRAYAQDVATRLTAAGLRTACDFGQEKIGYKVRVHSEGKIPLIAVVGPKDAAAQTFALRRLGGGQETLPLEAVSALVDEARPPF